MELVQYGGSERNDIVRFDDVAMIVSARQAAHHHDPGQAAKRQGPAKDVYMTATGTKPKNPCRRGKVHTWRPGPPAADRRPRRGDGNGLVGRTLRCRVRRPRRPGQPDGAASGPAGRGDDLRRAPGPLCAARPTGGQGSPLARLRPVDARGLGAGEPQLPRSRPDGRPGRGYDGVPRATAGAISRAVEPKNLPQARRHADGRAATSPPRRRFPAGTILPCRPAGDR